MKSATQPAKKSAASASVTTLIQEWTAGNASAGEDLWLKVYTDLKSMARRKLARERPDHTLESAALVSEVYMRLASGARPSFGNRLHFFAVCAKMMRQILVDYWRRHEAIKRQVSLSGINSKSWSHVDLIALDNALNRLTVKHPRKVRVVELRFFADLSHDEIASILGVSRVTVNRDWDFARAWLLAELDGDRFHER